MEQDRLLTTVSAVNTLISGRESDRIAAQNLIQGEPKALDLPEFRRRLL